MPVLYCSLLNSRKLLVHQDPATLGLSPASHSILSLPKHLISFLHTAHFLAICLWVCPFFLLYCEFFQAKEICWFISISPALGKSQHIVGSLEFQKHVIGALPGTKLVDLLLFYSSSKSDDRKAIGYYKNNEFP